MRDEYAMRCASDCERCWCDVIVQRMICRRNATEIALKCIWMICLWSFGERNSMFLMFTLLTGSTSRNMPWSSKLGCWPVIKEVYMGDASNICGSDITTGAPVESEELFFLSCRIYCNHLSVTCNLSFACPVPVILNRKHPRIIFHTFIKSACVLMNFLLFFKYIFSNFFF